MSKSTDLSGYNSYSSYSGEGFAILYESLYNKKASIKDSKLYIVFRNNHYGDRNYRGYDCEFFQLRFYFGVLPNNPNKINILLQTYGIKININDLTEYYSKTVYNYTVDSNQLIIGITDENKDCIFLYENYGVRTLYGHLIIKKDKISIVSTEDPSYNVEICNSNKDTIQNGIIYFKYDYSSQDKSYINSILLNEERKGYFPIMVSRENYCKYFYTNINDMVNNSKYYYLCNSDVLNEIYQLLYFNDSNKFNNGAENITFSVPKEFELIYLEKATNQIIIFELDGTNYSGSIPITYSCTLRRVYKNSDIEKFNLEIGLYNYDYPKNESSKGQLRSIGLFYSNYVTLYISRKNYLNYFHKINNYVSNKYISNCIFYSHIINNEKRDVKTKDIEDVLQLSLLAVNVKNTNTTNESIGWFSELLPNYSSVVIDNGGENIYNGVYGIKQILINKFSIENNEYNENHFRYNKFKTIFNLPLSEYGENLVDVNKKILPLQNSKIYFGYIEYKHNNEKRYAFFGCDGHVTVFCLNIVDNNGKVFSSLDTDRFTLYQDKLIIKFDSFGFNYANDRKFIPFDCEPDFDETKGEMSFNVTYVAVYDKTFTVQPNSFTKPSLIANEKNYYYNIKDIEINDNGRIKDIKFDDNGEIIKESKELIDGKYYLLVPIENNKYELISSIEFVALENKIYIQKNKNYLYSKIIKEDDNDNDYIEINFGNIGYVRFYKNSIVAYGEGLPNDIEINVRVAYPYDSYGDNSFSNVLTQDCLYAIQKSYANIAEFYDEGTDGELITKDLFEYIRDIYNSGEKEDYIRLYFTCNTIEIGYNNYYKLFSLTFYKNNTVELNSYTVSNYSVTEYKGGIFKYTFSNLYSNYNSIMTNSSSSFIIDDYITLSKNNIKIDFTKKYSIFNYMLCNNIQTLQNNYNLDSNNTFINEKEFKFYYFSSSTSLDKKPFYVEKLLEDKDKETFITNNIDKIIQKLKIVFSYLNTFDKYSLSTINENDKISDENLNDETVYIGFIQFQSNKYNSIRYIPIFRYKRNSYCFMSTNSYLGDSFNLFNYLYELENLNHDIENKKLYRNDDDNDYDHFKYSVNYIIPFDSKPLIENSTGKYYNVILNYALLTFYNDIKISSTISFYSNEQFDYSDDYQVEQLDGFIEGKDDKTFKIINSIDKIEKIYICYTIGSKLFRNLYILGDITNASSDYSHYKLNNLITNYKTKDEKIIEIKNLRNEFIVDNYELHDILFKSFHKIFGERFYIYNYGIEDTYYSMNYSNFTYNNVRNEENSKVLSIQIKFKE